jgi:hypothetical protein
LAITDRTRKILWGKWVKELLGNQPGGRKSHFALLSRIRTGTALSNIFGPADAYLFDHDDPETEEETRLIANFLQDVQDLCDIWSGLESSQQVEARFSLTQEIKEIETAGFLVFGTCDRRKMGVGSETCEWPVAVIKVARTTNNGITELGCLAVLIVH